MDAQRIGLLKKHLDGKQIDPKTKRTDRNRNPFVEITFTDLVRLVDLVMPDNEGLKKAAETHRPAVEANQPGNIGVPAQTLRKLLEDADAKLKPVATKSAGGSPAGGKTETDQGKDVK